MDVAITKISSKGQIVIPNELRGDLAVGEKLVIIKEDDKFIMKKANDLDKNFAQDLEFAKRTEEALKRYEAGEYKTVSSEDFSDELEKW